MKFFIKLQLSVIASCLCLGTILAITASMFIYNSMLNHYQNMALPIAEAAANSTDPEQFKDLVREMDETNPYYDILYAKLNILYKSCMPAYLYTMIKVNDTSFTYIVDGMDKSHTFFSPIGIKDTLENYESEVLEAFKGIPIATKIVYSEEWG